MNKTPLKYSYRYILPFQTTKRVFKFVLLLSPHNFWVYIIIQLPYNFLQATSKHFCFLQVKYMSLRPLRRVFNKIRSKREFPTLSLSLPQPLSPLPLSFSLSLCRTKKEDIRELPLPGLYWSYFKLYLLIYLVRFRLSGLTVPVRLKFWSNTTSYRATL